MSKPTPPPVQPKPQNKPADTRPPGHPKPSPTPKRAATT